MAQAGPGAVAESHSRQGIVTGTRQDCTDSSVLGSELLHSPGGAQGVPSCKTPGGTEIHTVGTGVCQERAAALLVLVLGTAWQPGGSSAPKQRLEEMPPLAWHCVHGPWVGSPWLSLTQFNPRSPCCGLPKVLLHWICSGRCLCRAVPTFQSLTWRLFVPRLEEWVCFPVDVKSKLQKR